MLTHQIEIEVVNRCLWNRLRVEIALAAEGSPWRMYGW
jgi:hypothetical protein